MITSSSGLTICLWFVKDAEKAAEFYVDVFSRIGHSARINDIARYSPSGSEVSGQKEGAVMTAAFELDGQRFLGLNGGPNPAFNFSGATSFVINCETQKEIDHFWKELGGNGGERGQCGWVKNEKIGN